MHLEHDWSPIAPSVCVCVCVSMTQDVFRMHHVINSCWTTSADMLQLSLLYCFRMVFSKFLSEHRSLNGKFNHPSPDISS